jgi:hypothetical protein
VKIKEQLPEGVVELTYEAVKKAGAEVTNIPCSDGHLFVGICMVKPEDTGYSIVVFIPYVGKKEYSQLLEQWS